MFFLLSICELEKFKFPVGCLHTIPFLLVTDHAHAHLLQLRAVTKELAHHGRGIPVTLRPADTLNSLPDLLLLILGQCDMNSCSVLLEILNALRTRDWNEICSTSVSDHHHHHHQLPTPTQFRKVTR